MERNKTKKLRCCPVYFWLERRDLFLCRSPCAHRKTSTCSRAERVFPKQTANIMLLQVQQIGRSKTLFLKQQRGKRVKWSVLPPEQTGNSHRAATSSSVEENVKRSVKKGEQRKKKKRVWADKSESSECRLFPCLAPPPASICRGLQVVLYKASRFPMQLLTLVSLSTPACTEGTGAI